MATKSKLAVNYSSAFEAILAHFASTTKQGRWFIINHQDDTDPNTLAHFLHLIYEELDAILKEIGVIVQVGQIYKFIPRAMSDFLHWTEHVEFTTTRMAYKKDKKPRDYQLLQIGAYPEKLGTFKFSQQLKMVKASLISTQKPRYSNEHRLLALYVQLLMSQKVPASATRKKRTLRKQQPSCTVLRTPDNAIPTQSKESVAKPQALFDTPTQELVGATRILDSIDMNDFPLLSKLNIRFLMDFYLHALQRELDKLGNRLKSVDLANVVSVNDKVHAQITVPKSGNWKFFSASAMRTKWLFKAVDSVLPMLPDDEAYDELDNKKKPNSSDVT